MSALKATVDEWLDELNRVRRARATEERMLVTYHPPVVAADETVSCGSGRCDADQGWPCAALLVVAARYGMDGGA